ncbi:hypothetical protein [Niallia sp. FSL R7-0271]|uniref:hypothetical protein n=1 Tax=Niallia sp. FSL R7-0271 TaxID=2921678 RepID=UPI0030F5146D
MVKLNKKAKVISFPNDYNRDIFAPYLVSLGKKAESEHKYRVQLAYLLKALDYMQYVDFSNLPTGSNRFFHELEITVEGKTYSKSFELIKPLAKENIYELRINIEESEWRFRAIFFPYTYKGVQYYCFIYPFVKKEQVQFDLTNQFRDKAYSIYYNLNQEPSKYVKYFK